MEKRSPSPPIVDSGCMFGFSSIFDFYHHGHSSQIPLKHTKHPSSRRIVKSFLKRVVKSQFVYSNKGKKYLKPSKILGISKADQNDTQNYSQKQSSSIRPEKSSIGYPKRGESNIFVEARKYLSERLRKVEMLEAVLRKQSPRTLEGVLLSSPKQEKNDGSVSVQIRFRPQLATEGSLQIQKEKSTFKLDDSNMICDSSSSKGYMKIFEASQEKNSTDTIKIFKENICSEQLRMESPSENLFSRFSPDLSSSSPVNICKLQTTSRDRDREESPSPVSILDPYFMDDAGSPTSIITEPAKPPLQPLLLDFDEHPEISLNAKTKEKETICNYISKVCQTSQLNWDEFLVKGCPSESSCDQKLLYDCIKEVLVDLHRLYFSSFIRSGIPTAPTEENVVNIVMKKVELYTTPRTMLYTFDMLMWDDIVESGKWVDIRADTDDIVSEIVEEALEHAIAEMILDIQTLHSAHLRASSRLKL